MNDPSKKSEPNLPLGTVTFLFTDIEGSTQLLNRLGEAYLTLLEDHHRLLRAVFDNCMATLNQEFTAVYEHSTPSDRLANLLNAMFALLARDKEFWALFYMLRTQPAIMRILGDDFRFWTRELRTLFQTEMQQANRDNPELDALLLYSLVEGTIQQVHLTSENIKDLAIGATIDSGDPNNNVYFKGKIDEVKIWNTILTDEKIREEYGRVK